MMSSKRARTPPISDSRTPSPEPTPKAIRTASLHGSDAAPGSEPLLCTLPPTCNPPNRPTPLANSTELEKHYAKYHAHVCEERGCGCVFPEERLLALHQTECHDPIAAVRKDRGEKIFACHLATCDRFFLTPKTRRLHLIQAHGYPKEYFFAVTNKGVGGLLKMWGDGASMIRGPWKSRSSEGNGESDGGDGHNDDGTGSENEDAMDSRPEGAQATPVTQPMNYSGSRSSLVIEEDDSPEEVETDDGEETETQQEGDHEENLGELTNAMGSLSLVPPTIQFGRGAKRGGFSHHGRGATPDQRYGDDPEGRGYSRGGRRGRGRGRGGPRGGGNRRQDQQQPFQSQNTVAQPTARLTRPPAPPRGLGGNRRSGFPSRGNIPGRGLPMRGGIGGK